MSGNLFASTLGVLSGRLTMPFFSFLLFFVTARQLSIGDFGQYVMLTGLITLFQGIAGLGVGQLLAREVGQKPEDEGLAVGSALAVVLPASAAAYISFLILAYCLKGAGPFLSLAGVMGASLPLSSLIYVAESVFMARGQGAHLFRLGMAEQIVRVAISIAALLAGYGLMGLSAAYVISRALGVVYAGVLYLRWPRRAPLALDGLHLRRTGLQLRTFAPIMIVGLLLYRSDVLTLGWFLTDDEMGLYGCAIRIVNLSFIAPDSVVAAAFPEVSRRWSGRVAANDPPDSAFAGDMAVTAEFLLAAGLFGAAAMAVAAPFALPVVFGEKYAAAAPLMAALAFMLPSHALEVQAGNLFQAIGRERTSLALMLVALPVFFGLLTLGGAAGGMAGAAIGFAAASWTMGLVQLGCLPPSAFSPAGRGLAWAIGLTLAGGAALVIIRPANDVLYCLLLAGAALTGLIASGIINRLRFARVKAVLSQR